MFYNLKNEQERPSTASKDKHYLAPSISVIVMEIEHVITASGPHAAIDDINYGGDLIDDIDDQ